MQKPFTLTESMATELENEINGLAPNGEESHDAVGKGPSHKGLRRRPLTVQDFGGAVSGQENNPTANTPLPAEDPINPAHYRSHPSGIECIEVTRHMNFNVGNAIKYLWRYMDKGDPIENLKKAQWYLDDEIRRLGGK